MKVISTIYRIRVPRAASDYAITNEVRDLDHDGVVFMRFGMAGETELRRVLDVEIDAAFDDQELKDALMTICGHAVGEEG